MAKAPADQFYFRDYISDTRSLSLAARGAWMDILSHGFFKTPQGRISQSLEDWATMFGCDEATAKTVLEAIRKHQVGDVVTNRNGEITVTNRRQYRAWEEKEANRLRQKRYRDHNSDEQPTKVSRKNNGKVTPYSSSSSSTASSSSSAKTHTHAREGPDSELSPENYEYPIKQLVEAFPNMRLTPAAIGFIESEVKPGDKIAWAQTISTYRMNFDPEHNRYLPEKTANLLSVFRSEKERTEKAREKNNARNNDSDQKRDSDPADAAKETASRIGADAEF